MVTQCLHTAVLIDLFSFLISTMYKIKIIIIDSYKKNQYRYLHFTSDYPAQIYFKYIVYQ